MSKLGQLLSSGLALAATLFTGGVALLLAGGAFVVSAIDAKRERKKQRNAFNAALEDRLTMIDVTPDAPRTLCMGRVRNVEGIRRRWSSGTNDEKLTMIVSFAGHEIDAYETWYLDDTAVTLDGSGWVQTAPWGRTERTSRSDQFTLNGSGGGTFTITATPESGTVRAQWFEQINSTDANTGSCTVVSVTGTSVVLSGGQASKNVWITYDTLTTTSYARIRPYLGTAAQNVGSAIAAEYPGKITATDKFAGIACAVCDFIYSPDVFPQGYPSVSAVFRGAKVLNPNTSVTEWTENPALHAYHYARHANGWALSTTHIRTADIIAAAAVCATSTNFTVTLTGGGTTTVTLPRYRCGIVIPSDADHREVMDSIVETMAGAWGWAGATFRLRAGTLGSTALTITEDWLVSDTDGGGGVSDEAVITGVQSIPREQRINRVTGSCVDAAQRYQVLPFPAVEDAVLVAAKGARPMEVTFDGVSHIAHAQHLAKIAIRSAQAGLRMEMTCGVQALVAELFDVAAVTLPDYGMTSKTFEVTSWTWSPTQAIRMRLAEITADIYVPTDTLTGRDPAPDSSLRAPWDVEAITGLAVASGTSALTDGSILSRASITWTAAVGANIRQGGAIEVQYREATLPTSAEWASWIEQGAATSAIISGLKSGRYYLFRVRAIQNLPLVRGAWSPSVIHQIAEPRFLDWANLNDKPAQFIARSRGSSDTAAPWSGAPNFIGGLLNAESGATIVAGANMYTVCKILRTSGAVTHVGHYDVYTDGVEGSSGGIAAANAMAAALNAIGSDHVVVVTTWDEPQVNRMQGNLPAAMYRCGASPGVFGASKFMFRGAYILIGIPGIGQGNGFEVYRGDTGSSTTAWAEVAFSIFGGSLIVSGTGTQPQIITDKLEARAATEIVALTGETSSASYARGSSPGSDPAKIVVLEQISWANTTGASVTLELSVSCVADQSVIGTGGSVRLRLDAGSSAFSDYTTADGDAITGELITVDTQFAGVKSYTVANGATAYVALNAILVSALSSTQSVNAYNTEMRITALKR